jgi:hypothetical protein
MFDGPLSEKSEKVQCAYLLIWLGEKGRDLFSTWTLADAEKTRSMYTSRNLTIISAQKQTRSSLGMHSISMIKKMARPLNNMLPNS